MSEFINTSFPINERVLNFRDISLYNPKIQSGIVFRSASMTSVQDNIHFEDFIRTRKIQTIIDLRADREVAEGKYSEASLKYFRWVHTPFDPWNQSIDFQATNQNGTDIEKAYRFFALQCKKSILEAIEAIIHENESIVIHCHAGKDRTGILVTLLHLASGADEAIIYNEYLASESDTKKEYMNIILEIIQQHNGITDYLLSCGLTSHQLSLLNKRLLKI